MSRFKQTILSRTCKKCHKHLTVEYFSRDIKARDGYDPVCKKCRKLRTIELRQRRKVERHNFIKTSINKRYVIEDEIEHRKQVKDDINNKCYDEFIKNIKLKPRTSKPKQISRWTCPVCQKNKVQSRHHIIPRKYTVNNDEVNLIWLCNACHDEIEMKTEEWIESGKRYDSKILRSMILNNGL